MCTFHSIILILLPILIVDNPIEIKLEHKFFQKSLCSFIRIGTPHFLKEVGIDLREEYSLILSNNFFVNHFSSSYQQTNITINFTKDKNLQYNLSSDIVMFDEFKSDYSLENFIFIYIMKKELLAISQRGFSAIFTLSRSKYSLVSLLFDKGLINKRLFYFSNNKIIIGNFPKKDINNEYKCQIKNVENEWICNLINISFNEKGKAKYNLPLNEGVIFDTSRMKISLPLKFLDFFEKNYFEKLIINKKCEKYQISNIFSFTCNSHVLEDFMEISFSLKSFIFFIPFSELFLLASKDEGSYDFLLEFANIENIFIGYHIIQVFDLLFDMDEGYIQFTSNINYLLSSQIINNIVYSIFGVNYLILLFGIIFAVSSILYLK